ncbi:hypothetical protein C8Q80DRAFT_1156088 [Daedaleopsis nitida]|nr:hypothetical protein C8Q80DRAFT_1156088 [Daedaleopsis nitida]
MSSRRALEEEYPSMKELRVPPEFATLDEDTESEIIVRLQLWKRRADEVLVSLRDYLRTRQAMDIQQEAEVAYATATFDGEEPWVSETSRATARDILSSFLNAKPDIVERILRDFVKPIFRPNPHPQVNVETGRKLPRPAGGPLGHLDFLEGQEWKNHPAIARALSWCISQADSRTVEKLWHLYIPPIMTLLDDHQAPYKMRGVRLASQLLQIASADLLRRTGIDILLLNSFKTNLTFLHTSETPDLIRATVTASLRLTEITTTDGSNARFEQLCSLLGDSIIGNVWIYAANELDTIEASVNVLPDIVRVFDIGSARYLKALIPQLTFPLIPAPENGASMPFKQSSLRALCAVMLACAPRIPKWRGTILDAILRCWIHVAEQRHEHNAESVKLQKQLRSACALLTSTCEPVVDDIKGEYTRVLALNPELFTPLFTAPVKPGDARNP